MTRSRGFVLALVVVTLVLSGVVVQTVLQYVLLAILLAYVLAPLQRRLEPRIGARLAAGTLLLATVLLVLVPISILLTVIAEDVVRLAEDVDLESVDPARLESLVEEYAGIEANVTDVAQDSGREVGMMALERTVGLVGTTLHVLLGLGLALFLLYYLLKDGDALLAWIRRVTPLPDDVQDELFDELDGVMGAVIVGHAFIALIQGVIAGLGLFATGIPNALFWTVVMIVLAVIPIVGAFLVWGPAVGYLVLTGEPLLAVGLFLYSFTVVSVSDDYLRPIVVDRYAQLNPAVIILGVLGGVYAFGVMGLFFGPIVLGALKATVTVADEHYERLGPT